MSIGQGNVVYWLGKTCMMYSISTLGRLEVYWERSGWKLNKNMLFYPAFSAGEGSLIGCGTSRFPVVTVGSFDSSCVEKQSLTLAAPLHPHSQHILPSLQTVIHRTDHLQRVPIFLAFLLHLVSQDSLQRFNELVAADDECGNGQLPPLPWMRVA